MESVLISRPFTYLKFNVLWYKSTHEYILVVYYCTLALNVLMNRKTSMKSMKTY